jgi:hypothetical protein
MQWARVLIAAVSTSGLLLPNCNIEPPDKSPDGSFNIGRHQVDTDKSINAGSVVRVKASGKVNFGGAVLGIGAPILDADGDDAPTPSDYPAPQLRKNSLICMVGSRWYQCGRDEMFRTPEAGILKLRPNDNQLADNSGTWRVEASTTTLADDAAPYEFSVRDSEVTTGLTIRAGSTVRVLASGLIDFGGAVLGFGAPILTADGDDAPTPSDYPAPELRKNSLICKVGSRWYQGGQDVTFHPSQDGALILRPNDKDLADNSRGWKVSLVVTPR